MTMKIQYKRIKSGNKYIEKKEEQYAIKGRIYMELFRNMEVVDKILKKQEKQNKK